MAWRDRLRQGVQALIPTAPPPERDAIISEILTPAQAAAFRQLPAFDQRHLLRVYQRLRSAGERDEDVLIAALLHDIGKVGTEGRVRLPHRVARVLLARFAPGLLGWLARLPAPRWRAGFALAVHHPTLGAERAATLGCSKRVCWLIAHHEDDPPPPDPGLCRLIAADRAE
ncbi:MAG TPA: HD domain-containing protein [Thermomicrobiales bacterium]